MKDSELLSIAARLQRGEADAIADWYAHIGPQIAGLKKLSEDQSQRAWQRVGEIARDITNTGVFPWNKGPVAYVKDEIKWATLHERLAHQYHCGPEQIDAVEYDRKCGLSVPKLRRLYDKFGNVEYRQLRCEIEEIELRDSRQAACVDDLDRQIVKAFLDDFSLDSKDVAELLGVGYSTVRKRITAIAERIREQTMDKSEPRDMPHFNVFSMCLLAYERRMLALLAELLRSADPSPYSAVARVFGVPLSEVYSVCERIERGWRRDGMPTMRLWHRPPK